MSEQEIFDEKILPHFEQTIDHINDNNTKLTYLD